MDTPPPQKSFRDHFSATAADYAAHRPTYPRALADFLADLARRHDLAWDAGCGSGQFSLLLAERFARVVATDASQEQLASAAPHPRIDYRCAPAEKSGLPGGCADLAFAAQAAHWFDLPAYYAEVRRVAREDALVALVTYGLAVVGSERDGHDGERDAASSMGNLAGVVRDLYALVAPHWPPERTHVDDGYRSLPFPFAEVQAPPLAMSLRWTLADFAGYVHTWSSTRALIAAHGKAPIEAGERALARAWGDPTAARTIRWPLSLRVGRVTTRT